MSELRGKGWRVLGYFIWMLGAGVVLDRPECSLGSLLAIAGLLIFLAGAAQSLRLPVGGEP
jgi:hypothetical protein